MGVQIPPGAPIMSNVKSVSDIVDSTLKDAGLTKAVELWSIYKVFRDVFADEIADNMRILSLRNKTLKVKLPSSVWVQELSFFEDKLVEKINTAAGSEVVKNIKFTEV